ncbi:MAG: ADOP family duplicated permease [Gemmatimonadota bacterium]
MNLWRRWLRRLRARLSRERLETEMDEEMRFHVQMEAEELERTEGLDPKEARRRALVAFGGVEQVKEHAREVRRVRWLEDLIQDARLGLRGMRRAPGFTAVAVLTLALGIGANTTIFSVVDATVLRPSPYPDADRLVLPRITVSGADYRGPSSMAWSYPKFEVLRESERVFESVAGFRVREANVRAGDTPVRLEYEAVTEAYFDVLDVAPALGRGFVPIGADESVQPAVAVVSHGLWQRRWGGDPAVLGATLTLGDVQTEVVGVMPPGFRGLSGAADAWVPVGLMPRLAYPAVLEEPGAHWLDVVARLEVGVTDEALADEMARLGAVVEEAHPAPAPFAGRTTWSADAVPLAGAQSDPLARRSLLAMLGAVGFVLLIACVNLANLTMARATARGRELAVRAALGSGRGRLVRQLLTESVLLALVGGAVGAAVAFWASDVVTALRPVQAFDADVAANELLGFDAVAVDARVLAFTLVLSVLTGILFGLAPALRASRTNLAGALKQAGAAVLGRGRAGLGARGALVTVEIALSLVLLVGAGLLLESFARLQAIDPGFRVENLLAFRVDPQLSGDGTESAVALHSDLMDRIRALPGVEGVSVDKCTPLSRDCNSTVTLSRDGRPLSDAERARVSVHFVGPDHFDVLGVPVVRGRGFTPDDRAGARRVVVISESAARALWPGEDAIGRTLGIGMAGLDGDTAGVVVGVVGDVRYGAIESPPAPAVYVPDLQSTWASTAVLVRATRDPESLIPALRRAVRAVDDDLPLYDVRTMGQRVGQQLSLSRFAAVLLGAFSVLALLLAAVGVYGVMAEAVQRRTHEVGLRMALGASRRHVLRMVVRQSARPIVLGLVLGIPAAYALTRAMSSLLYDVGTTDAGTYAAVAVGLGLVALAASYVPARRAAGVDPLKALRSE